MIDFKYHLVSLISVFMALAIGVVLGAGPLQQSIGNGLAEQVSSLRSDKESLQSTTRSQQDTLDDDDSYLTAATAPLVTNSLSGKHVVVLRLQNPANGDVKALQGTLRTAGATVNGTVTVDGDWTDPAQSDARTSAAAAVARADHAPAPTGDPATYLDTVLGQSVASRATSAGTRSNGQAVLQAMDRAGIASVDGSPWQRADLVVLVAGPQTVRTNPSSQQKSTDEQTNQALLALTQAVGGQAKATVLSGPRRTDQVTSLVAGLRSGGADRTVSGVDDVDHPMGRINTALVAKNTLGGTVEQVGTAGDAQTVVPQVLASATSTP